MNKQSLSSDEKNSSKEQGPSENFLFLEQILFFEICIL